MKKPDDEVLASFYKTIIPVKNSVRFLEWKDRVVFVDPDHTYISTDSSDFLEIGDNTVVMPGCRLLGKTSIGKGCFVGANCLIENSLLQDECRISPNCSISDSALGTKTRISHCSIINLVNTGEDVFVGPFACITNTQIGDGTIIFDRLSVTPTKKDGDVSAPTKIGANVKICSSVIILGPVEIGNDCVILVRAIVADNIKPHRVVGIENTHLRSVKLSGEWEVFDAREHLGLE